MTLSDGTTTITLRADLAYPERYRVQRARTETQCFGGALVVEDYAVQTIAGCDLLVGEHITLTAEESGSAVLPTDAEQLRAWAITPGQRLTLAALRDLPALDVAMGGIDLRPIWAEADANPAPYWFGSVALTVLGAA